MSNTESDKSDSNERSGDSEKFMILDTKEIVNMDLPLIVQYIDKLHKELQVKEKMLKKYKEKTEKLVQQIEELKSSENVEKTTAAHNSQDEQAEENEKTNELECTNSKTTVSLVDEIRQAAEQAQNLSGFVYEPTSGLYYDQKTGYYYNAEYGLYYDGNTGCYYNYNQDKNVFEFHSQVEVQPNQIATSEKNDNDDGNNAKSGDLDVEVHFDEHGGVITDEKTIRALRKEKRRQQRELEKIKKRKKKSKKSKSKKNSKSSKKRKRSHRSEGSTDENSSDERKPSGSICKHDMEDGEISESSTNSCDTSSDNDSSENEAGEESGVPLFKAAGRFQDIAKKYPPSLRIIVQETNSETLKVGSLGLITFKGGSLGREGNHDVIIPDVNVSKSHLEFSYDKKKCVYKCTDLGSQNGTILNGERMSAPKVASEPYDLVHGSVIQIGQTKLLCHTHEGNSTCGLCEPGLLIEAQSEKDVNSMPTVHLTHKEQLKRLQKKYGLENEKFVDGKQVTTDNYNDRAATRRHKVGSSTDKEKTQSASVSTAISSENKGFKLLSKLGWTEGEALGKNQTENSLLEPINVFSNEGKKGLGCNDVALPELSFAEKKKIEAARKMQERYQNSKGLSNLIDESS